MEALNTLLNTVSAWSTPILLSLSVYFLQRFIAGVDEKLKALDLRVGQTTINLAEKTAEIKISLNSLAESAKHTADKLSSFAKELDEIDDRLKLNNEFHAKIIEAHERYTRAIERNTRDIESIITKIGNLTFIRERKKT